LSCFFYEHHLPANNFSIENLELNGNYFEYLAQENRRIKSIAKKYSGIKLNIVEKALIHSVLYLLERLSKKDKGSSELLCYGVHVFGRKL
jgi:hypothetical protein